MIGKKINYPGYFTSDEINWCDTNGAHISDVNIVFDNGKATGGYYEIVANQILTLDELKQRKLQEAGLEFANRRDAIRWVGEYGFDCTVEDITNFMAAFTPLLVEKSGNVYYKVWLEEQKKGIVQLNYEQMQAVYDAVRVGQLEAYAWYETIKARTLACETKEDLEAITW